MLILFQLSSRLAYSVCDLASTQHEFVLLNRQHGEDIRCRPMKVRLEDDICKSCVTRGGGRAEERIMFSEYFLFRDVDVLSFFRKMPLIENFLDA